MVVREIIDTLHKVRESGLSILIVEQNIRAAFALAQRHYVLSKGAVCYSGSTQDLERNETVLRDHLGV